MYLYLCIRVPQQQLVVVDPTNRFATLLRTARACACIDTTVGYRKVLQGGVEVRIGGLAPQKVNHSRRSQTDQPEATRRIGASAHSSGEVYPTS